MPEWPWPSNNNWRIWCVSRFYVKKYIKQTYKSGLHFTVICCTNKCIINARYIPEHQNKLNIYDLQNYEFFTNFFNRKKFVKFVIFYEWKKFVKFVFSIYDLHLYWISVGVNRWCELLARCIAVLYTITYSVLDVLEL